MGMSASQARFLSITARMHDLEFQAQELDNSKLSLTNDSNMAYEEYCKDINATKFQMTAISGGETKKVDVTYAALLASANQPLHHSYMLTDAVTDEVYLPEAVAKNMNNRIPETLNEFLEIVATKYVYAGRGMDAASAVQQMSIDGYTDYWTAIYYQMTGYTDAEGVPKGGRGFISVSTTSANDREWIKNKIERGEAIFNKLQTTEDVVGEQVVNIFAQTSMSTDPDLSEANCDLIISRAEAKYENKMDNIDQKDKQLDVRLARIENEHRALKTEYETVKELVKKNIERSYKTFNA